MAQKKSAPAIEVARAIERAWSLVNRRLFDDAWNVLVEAEDIAKGAGIESPFLHWALSVAADNRCDPPNAVHHIMAALKGDPCAPPILGSYRIIARRVRYAFDQFEPADDRVSLFYSLLLDLGATDAAATMKYSQCATAHGDHEAALAAARFAVESEPPTPERLRHLSLLLERAGRVEEARARRDEAELLAEIFPVPEAQA